MNKNKRMKFYKYIHVLYMYETNFNKSIVKMIDESDYFEPSQHLFVTPHKNVFNELEIYGNVAFFDTGYSGPQAKRASVINAYGDMCDWLILHCSCKSTDVPYIKKKFLNKIIWRTWGVDQRVPYGSGISAKNIVKKYFVEPIWKKRICRYKAIGVANTVDIISLTSKIPSGLPEFIQLGYGSPIDIDNICFSTGDSSKKTKVMIGHRSGRENNHFEILKKLQKFCYKEIEVYVMCSLCPKNEKGFIEEMKTYASSYWNNNVYFMEDFQPFEEYINLLNQMDIIILDGKGSYALGNIGLAIFLRKKLFLNRGGIIKKAFDHDHIPHCCTDEIEKMSFDEFAKPVQYSYDLNTSLEFMSYDKQLKQWHDLFGWLNAEGEKNHVSK